MLRDVAVEVVSLFEDAVQEVRYLRRAEPKAATPWFIGGGVGFGLMAIAFVFAFAGVASLWLDALASAGAAAGVVGVAMGFARRRPARSSLALPRGARVEIAGDVFVLDVGDASGEVGARALVAGERLTLMPATPVRLVDGALSALIALVDAPAAEPLTPVFDWRAQTSTAAAAMLAGIVAMIAAAAPPDASSLSVDRETISVRFPMFTVKPPQPEETKEAAAAAGAKGQRAKGESGEVGKKDATRERGVMAHVKTTSTALTQPADIRARAATAAQEAGVLSMLNPGEASHIGAIFRPESALGVEASRAMEGLQGTELSDGRGTGGLNLVGSGTGGGGDGNERTIAAGPLGSIRGKGPGGGGGEYGSCKGKDCGLGPKKRAVIESPTPDVRVTDARNKEEVRRVIRHHMNEVRFCYEKQLAQKADLSGRVVVSFTIDTMGRVPSSVISQTSLADRTAETCIAEAVRRWEFGSAKGMAIVSYPFVFHRVGAN